MTCRNSSGSLLAEGAQGKEVFLVVGSRKSAHRYLHLLSLMRQEGWEVHLAASDGFAVCLYCPEELIIVKRGIVESVGYLDAVLHEGYWLEGDVLVNLLHLPDMWMQRAVGCYKSVGTEVGIVYYAYESHIATISPVFVSLVIGLGDGLVYPVPDETTLQLVVFVNQIPVILEITLAVTHGMGVFAENQRTLITLVDMAAQRPDAGIHRTVDIRLGVVTAALILYRTGWIHRLAHIVEFLETLAISALVTHRPDDDGGMVAVALDHAVHAVVESRIPVFSVCQLLIFSIQDTMTLDVCLAYHVETILIAELIPLRIVWIVRGTHGIDVELLHHLHILHHLTDAEGSAVYDIVLLSVHTLNGDGYTIYQKLSVLHFDGTEAERLSHTLLYSAIPVGSIDDECVEIRALGTPRLHVLQQLFEMNQGISR